MPIVASGEPSEMHRILADMAPARIANNRAEVFGALDRGELVVTCNGFAVEAPRPARRRFIPRDVLVEAFRQVPAIDPEQLMDDLDAVLDQKIEPRA